MAAQARVKTVVLTHLTAKPDDDYTAWGKRGKEALFRTSAHRQGPDGVLISRRTLRVIWARHVARFLPHGKCYSLGYGRCLPGDVLTGRNSVLRIFVIAAALMLTPSAFAQQPSRYGTADEAKAMLLKVVAAVKADKTKALESLIKTFVCHLGQVFMLRDLPCRTTC